MSRTRVFRTIIAGGTVIAMVTVMPTLAIAGGTQGKSGSHGNKPGISVPGFIPAFPGGFNGEKNLAKKSKKFENEGKSLEARARTLEKKLEKKGSANPAIATAVTVYKSVRDTAITAFQTATKSARDAYQLTTSPASDTQKAAYLAAKTALQIALASATTDQTKQIAQDAYNAALKAANEAFKAATADALARYKAAVTSAQQVLNAALQAANLTFRKVLPAVHTDEPSPS
jgi:hypothetical protein